MRIAIVGAGAIGGVLGHGLQRGGHDVTLLDLPPRVEQIRAMGGLVVTDAEGATSCVVPSLVTTDFASAGTQELVILATKSYDLLEVAPQVAALMEAGTVVMTVQNGIPWWYFHGADGQHSGHRIECLDPDGRLEKCIPSRHVIGCVAYPAAAVERDGRIRHVEGRRFPVGELDGLTRDRTGRIVAVLEEGGFKSRALDDIRSEIWLKALGAVSINPISALTGATMSAICRYEPTRRLVEQIMGEIKSISEALGVTLRHSIAKRIEGAMAVGEHKTSMLQDVEAGRPLELDAIMLAVLEIASLTGVEAPAIRNVYSCAALLNERLVRIQRVPGGIRG